MRYYVRVGDTQYDVTIRGESLTIDGEPIRAQIQDLPGTPMQLVTIGEAVHRIHATRGDRKGAYDIAVEGFRFAVEALDERSRAIRELAGGSGKAAGPVHLVAPMPGLIVRVNIGEGDHVRAGQGLVVMEAMKMENELRAPADATVKRIMVSPGSAVEKGAMILEMEVGP